MTQEPIVLRMDNSNLETRINQIKEQFGIDPTLLLRLVRNQDFSQMTQELSKHAKRKLRRNLQGSEQTFEKIAQAIKIHSYALIGDMKDKYHETIMSQLSDNQRIAYSRGNWTYEILMVVSEAQRRYMIPSRAQSPAEVSHKARFAPHGEYQYKFKR